MRITEIITESVNHYYHGSYNELPVGTILTPRDDYENDWQDTNFYAAIEMYRPTDKLAHKQSVFMCDNPDDVDLAGAATDWLFTVVPIGEVQRHDMNWLSEISSLVDLGFPLDSDEIKDAAEAYWSGEESPNEVVWEYLTPSAKIVKVEKY